MGYADAMSVRVGGWGPFRTTPRDAGGTELIEREDRARPERHAGLAPDVHRTAPQFLSALAPKIEAPSDAWLKRAIPALLLVLLAVAVAARIFMLAASADEVDERARQSLALVAELASERLLDRPGLEDVANDPDLARELLVSVRAAGDERTYALVSSTGKLFAASEAPLDGEARVHTPSRTPLAGGDLPRIIIALAGQAGTGSVTLANGSRHLASLTRVTILPSGETLMVLV